MSRRSFASSRRRALGGVLAALVTAGGTSVQGQPAQRVIGVMSLVGDRLTVIGQESTTGTKLNRNPTESLQLSGGALDRVALLRLMQGIGRAEPRAKVMPMLVNEPRYYEGQGNWLDGDKATLPPEVQEALRGAGMTHLLLVLKHRDDARMMALETAHGTGKVEGLGFYLDRTTSLRETGTSNVSVGYIAPYVYIRVALVDLASGRVAAKHDSARGRVYAAAGTDAKGLDPWDILNTQAKVEAIKAMIERELDAALATVLKT